MSDPGGKSGGLAVCSRCGKVLRGDYRFCTHCGLDLRKDTAPETILRPQPPSYPPFLSPPRRVEPMALASFICGLVSFFLIPLLPAVAALVLGIVGRNHIRQNPQLYEGETYAVVGIALGAFNILLVLVVVLMAVISVLSSSGM